MTPEQIRGKFGVNCVASTDDVIASALAEIAAQLAELNEKFIDFFATQLPKWEPEKQDK